ncbi:hypothetical protein [Helicobacter pylori]|uniref:hypothetical protein n=1 Tax=Helicobacter pylori TaxID=210 RepID=UPI0009588AC6|nr:hypothetical protein [Helicobacter pylori]BAW36333.1 uncharacterized protein HPF13_0668 [Helicobacter pylori]BAW45541.1 uncharacterized protein HPF211_0659 [Helicobacter pylori]BAW59395.1 uncharacterized protein HPF67_0670 [Helicobacter pylori]BAW67344.1 uncharacterized protein HPF90_0728 [Helicobacter pylori]
MKNINLIKHFKNIENIKKKRLAFKKAKKRTIESLKNKGYRDFIAKIKSKNQSDEAVLENLELSYLNASI